MNKEPMKIDVVEYTEEKVTKDMRQVIERYSTRYIGKVERVRRKKWMEEGKRGKVHWI